MILSLRGQTIYESLTAEAWEFGFTSFAVLTVVFFYLTRVVIPLDQVRQKLLCFAV
ncbi:MAG: hypothetical protein HQL07_08580 [Nitrospirae bacterium]|nr:hypothetical protein [Magnetococcales bacterium]